MHDILADFRKFVDLIERRAMACDGPATPFLEEIHAASDAEKTRFTSILAAIYKVPPPSTQVLGDGEAAIIECLAAGKPFVFDPATNFLHADDGTVEYGIRYVPDDRPPAPADHVVGVIAAFEEAYPEFYYHVAKGKITAGEPLYGAIITTALGTEIGHGESDVSVEEAFKIAIDHATDRLRAALATATPEKQP